MEIIIKKILGFLTKSNAISHEDTDIYEYGLYVIISDIIDFSITFIAAFLIGAVPQTIVYYIAFIGLRRTAGGYHASTRLRCFVISMVTWYISIRLIQLTEHNMVLSMGYAVVSCLSIWLFSPVEHSNNPLTPEQVVRMRKLSRIYVLLLALAVFGTVALIPLGIPYWVSSSLAHGMIFFTGSLLVAKTLQYKKASSAEREK